MSDPNKGDALLELAERLERMIAEPSWQVFYLQKSDAALILSALRSRSGNSQ